MELYLIRHGESFNNRLSAAEAAKRACDPPLTERGEAQARRLADYLAGRVRRSSSAETALDVQNRSGCRFTRLFCSPMLRALQTAAPIAETLGMRPRVWIDIHEQGGIWLQESPNDLPGLSRGEMVSRFTGFALPEGVTETGWWHRPLEREPEWVARSTRVAKELKGCFAATDERIAIVTHGGFASCLLHALLNGESRQDAHFSHQNTAMSRVDFEADRATVCYLNRIDHLPSELVS